MSKGSNTTTTNQNQMSSVAPSPQAMAAYSSLMSRATDVSNTPFTPYTGQEVAPTNAQQLMGVGNTNLAAMGFAPYAGQAGSYISAAGTPVSASDISQYMDPYQTSVINATQADFDTQNKRAQSATTGNAAAQGALGGNRVGVAQALTQEGQERVQAPVMAGLESQGFQNAVTNANAQKQRQLQSGQVLSGAALTAAQQQFAFGTQEQQTSQAQDTQQMTDYYTQQGYPFATAQWLAAITLGTGAQMGSTSTGAGQSVQQGPQPNQFAQAAGLGISALAAYSDRRLKENIKEIGRLHDGQKIYRYNFKGDPQTHVGMISQEVEKKHPEAVGKVAGFGTINYDEATKDAVKKWSGGAISGFAAGGTPYGPGTQGWVPTIGNIGGHTLQDPGMKMTDPKMPQQAQPDYSKMGAGLGKLGKSAWDSFGSSGGYDWNADPTGGYGGAGMDVTSGYAGGGRIGYDSGGAAPTTPSDEKSDWQKALNRYGFPASIDDIRTGNYPLGVAAIGRATRKGMEDGGDPAVGFSGSLLPKFNDRFDAIGDESSAPRVPINLPPSAGFSEPVKPSLTGVERPSRVDEMAAIGKKVRERAPPEPLTGEGEISPAAATDMTRPTSGYADQMSKIAAAHREIESGNNYHSVGVPSPKDGDRPYGAYQVMGKNVGPWTQQYLGRAMTPQEFLKDPVAQDTVYKARMGQYINQYGLTGALDHWLGMGKSDYLGTTHPEYQRRFMAALQGGPEGVAPEGGGVDISARDRSIRVPGVAGPEGAPTRPGMGGFNPLGLSDEARQGLISMGLGMMSNRVGGRGSFLAGMGDAGAQGMTTYASARAATAAQDALQRKEAFEKFKTMLPYNEMTQEQKANLSEKQEADARAREFHEVPTGYRKTKDGGLEPVPGGPADPSTIGAAASAKLSGGLMSDAAVDLAVDRIKAGDPTALQNMGRGAQSGANLTRVQNRLAERSTTEGWSGADIAAARANFTAQAAAARTASVREANVQTAVNEARNTFELAETASKELPRTQFVPWNKAVQAIQSGSSSPELRRYVTALRGAMTAYSQAMSRTGTNSVYAQQSAEELLQKADSHQAIMATLEQMRKEMDAAEIAPELTRQAIMARISGKGKAAPSTMDEAKKAREGEKPVETKARPTAEQKALDWANANPKDPRSAEIKKRLGDI